MRFLFLFSSIFLLSKSSLLFIEGYEPSNLGLLDLKKDKIFLSILDLKFPKIKKQLYIKYKESYCWNIFVHSSPYTNFYYKSKQVLKGGEKNIYYLSFDRVFYNSFNQESIKKLKSFFYYLYDERKNNSGINFKFLSTYFQCFLRIEGVSIKDIEEIFVKLFNINELEDKNFIEGLSGFLLYAEDENLLGKFFKDKISKLINLYFSFLIPSLKNHEDLKYIVIFLLEIKFIYKINFNEINLNMILRGRLGKKDKEVIKSNPFLKRYSQEMKKFKWLQ